MSLSVRKEKGGFAVFEGRDALVRGLREKREAHMICSDIKRKGFFTGTVTFARGGRVLAITVPAEHWVDPPAQTEPDAGEGTVDDL